MVTQVTSDVIADGSITGPKIAAGAITGDMIPDNSINGAKIALGGDAIGDLMYYNGTNWVRLPAGAAGSTLRSNGAAAPSWISPSYIRLNGNNGTTVNFTASQQVLTSSYFSQEFVNGSLSWNSSTGRVTTSAAGVYQVSFIIYIQTASANGNGRLLIRVNDANSQLVHTGNGADGTVTTSVLLNMAANQYVDIIADGFDLPGAYMGGAHSTFCMHRVG